MTHRWVKILILILSILNIFVFKNAEASRKKREKLSDRLLCSSCQNLVTSMKIEQDSLPQETHLSSRHRLDERASSRKIPYHRSEQALFSIFEKLIDKGVAKTLAVLDHTIQPKLIPKGSDERATYNDTNTKAIKVTFQELATFDMEFVEAFQQDRTKFQTNDEKNNDENNNDDVVTNMMNSLCIKQLKLCDTLDFGDVVYVPPPPKEEKTEEQTEEQTEEKTKDQNENNNEETNKQTTQNDEENQVRKDEL
jgi:hypothetical protein